MFVIFSWLGSTAGPTRSWGIAQGQNPEKTGIIVITLTASNREKRIPAPCLSLWVETTLQGTVPTKDLYMVAILEPRHRQA